MMSNTLTSSSKQTQDKDKGKPKKRRAKKAEKPANVVAEVQSERAIPDPIDFANDSFGTWINKSIKAQEFIERTVKFIGFSVEQTTQISSRLLWTLIWKPCVDAYKAFPGIKATPGQVMQNRGITYVNSTALTDPSIESRLGTAQAETVRTILLGRVNAGVQASTISPTEHSGDYEALPSQRIITTFNLGNWHSDLDEDVFHEMVHGSGVPGDFFVRGMLEGIPIIGSPYSHDLKNYKNKGYDALLKACKPPF